MLKIGRFPECFMIPVQIPQPFMDMRIIMSNGFHVCLEEMSVYCIKTDDRDVQPDIDFGDGGSKIIGARGTGQVLFNSVKTFKEHFDSCTVRGLCLCHTCFTVQWSEKTGFTTQELYLLDPTVHPIIHPVVDLVNLWP